MVPLVLAARPRGLEHCVVWIVCSQGLGPHHENLEFDFVLPVRFDH